MQSIMHEVQYEAYWNQVLAFEIALPTKPVAMHVCPSLILHSKTTFVLCDATFPNATQNVVWL